MDIPRDKLTVITGVSGSGKSSLAFDTLFAEGQRQYIDSLSAYARQFLDQIPRPDVDSIDGLAPTLAIDQKPGSTHGRSTVATISEIYDYLRLLYARVGTPHCANCNSAIAQQSPDAIVESLASLPDGTKIVLMAPMVRGRRGVHREVFDSIRQAGLLRVRTDGETYLLDEVPELAPRKNHTIEAVIDRLVIRSDDERRHQDGDSRLRESVLLALRLGNGLASSLIQDDSGDWKAAIYSTAMACVECGASFEEIEPRTFSFNSPYGACRTCDGLGHINNADQKETCPDCGGGRLCKEALSVTIKDTAIHQLAAMPLGDASSWMATIDKSLSSLQSAVAAPITAEVIKRLSFLQRVGVEYLTLDRAADSLSGGELQRVRLATSIGSGLVGVCYVLDEPSIGLHPADHDRLIDCIEDLRKQGNTVIIVEHDEATMRAADCLIDMGEGAGSHGGKIISQGTPKQVEKDTKSLTGQYLSRKKRIPIPKQRRVPKKSQWIELADVKTHNLKNVTAKFPLGMLVGISGVSGSGKSSLVNDTLAPALAAHLGLQANAPGPFGSLKGAESIDKLILIDQSPIGRSPRSCPATYCGVLDEIRKVFATTREAKTRGFTTSRFSFNSAAGRCELCKGLGVERIEMNFLSDLFVSCTRCGGKRFNRQTLQVRFKGASVADVLAMSVDDAATFFENVPRIERQLRSLQSVGLGYVHLGQSSTTLSGGEAQRIKLGTELARVSTGQTLYLLDEPTTGLHFQDIERLVAVLQQLVDSGNTVLVIEHQFDLLAACDWIIDLGPTGGLEGGHIIGEGAPETIATNPSTPTGKYLHQVLSS
ncbi:excinuclease ABC subunit UvrA [Novipirellula herctigrandis]|uniref:excinuclease ABC subunit UvrA n=1 Tax=Novipirellula herctigrandis TaxID=2527986 RepID=UPI003AF3D375